MTIESEISYFYSKSGPERGGLVSKTSGLIELNNVSEKPDKEFSLSIEDQEKLSSPDIIGTFHTHPGGSSNLSYDDWLSFYSYPRLTHYIYGEQGLMTYKIQDGVLLNVD